MSRARFDLVIFDCDGVLVDSERLANTQFAELLAELGIECTLEQMYRDFVGRSMAACMQTVTQRLGRPPPRDFEARLRARTRAAFERELRPVDGVEAVLDRLPMPACVASSGDHEKMRLTLGITGLLPRFEGRLFSATEVARGKPWPDVFLHAAARMGAAPEHTAVVEDSPAGVRAGTAAGMTVFGYTATMGPGELRAAGATVFHHMSELPALLGLPP